ncbi:MAG: hypothetical protein AUJ82_04135 [Verrucomicrobia bacterium CG1_02_43_26]|nr:MAG: hypothetical protein AUJ82_04135 [Verrucomicrobia bacterium CG1_02_43_26]
MDYELLDSITVNASGGEVATIFYKCYASSKARNISLTIKDNCWVRIAIPKRAQEKDGLKFLQTKAEWVLKHLQRPQLLNKNKGKCLLNLIENGQIVGFIPDTRVMYRLGQKKISWVYDETENLLVLNLSQTTPCLREIRALLVSFSKNTLPEHTINLAKRAGIEDKLRRVTVRNQRTRWGSCTSLGTISLNWRLILLPKHLHDAVIQHELAHLLHMNHGPKFKQALAKLDPAYEFHSKLLNQLSPQIISL